MPPEAAVRQVRQHAAAENFVRQNGFADADAAACAYQFPALMFQPRVIAVVVLAGLVLQAWQPFLFLSAVLWWNVLVPRLNPFDGLHNRFVGAPKGIPPLPPAAGPRRFAQAMAATSTLGVALSLWFGSRLAALAFEAIVVTALTMLLVGRLCLGSYLFHLLRGQAAFANRTLPWGRE
jgi:Domain of unknown function (DUF4395)